MKFPKCKSRFQKYLIALKLFNDKVCQKKIFAAMVHKRAAAYMWRLVVCFLCETSQVASVNKNSISVLFTLSFKNSVYFQCSYCC
jgi:hypothetical protein